jgi:GntR family transcriptional regulator of arabinose operon
MKTHTNKLERIHTEMRDRIISGKFQVGEPLPIENQLAAEFGCSIGTISKALALLKHEGFIERRTRAGTRVINRSGIVSNPLPTKDLALDAFALIYPTQQHEGIWRNVRGFQEAAREASRRTVMLSVGLDLRKETELIARLAEFDVKGAVIYPVLPEPQDVILFSQALLKCRFPIVLGDLGLPGMGFPVVSADGFHAGLTMTEWLIRSGSKRIGFLADYAWTAPMRDRYMGYRRAMEDAGLEVDPANVLLETAMRPDFSDPLRETTALGRRLLHSAKKIDAVVAANDFLALGCIEAAAELGLKVPKDLKVVGMDDFAIGSNNQRGLTSYHIPYEELGRRSFAMLNDLVSGGTRPAMEVQIRGEVIVRKTG